MLTKYPKHFHKFYNWERSSNYFLVFFTGIFGPYYQWLAAVTDEYIRIHRPGPNDGVHEICRQTMPPSPSMINMHTQPMPVYINATASRPAPGRIHISANPNPLVTPVRPIYGQPSQQSTGPTSMANTFQALQNQSNSTGSVNTPMRWSTSVAGIQSVRNQNMNLSAGIVNEAMSPANSTFQPVGHESIPLGLPSANPTMAFATPGSAFQPVGPQSIPLRPAAVNPAMTSVTPASGFQPVGHQSINLRPPAVNPIMTSLPQASTFIPVGQQSIHLTPGSVNEAITLSSSTSAYQPVGSPSIHFAPASVQNDSIGASANATISMSPAATSLLQVIPNEGINVAASPVITPNHLQQGTMSPHANQFQSMTSPIGIQPNPLQQATMSPQGNQFASLTNPIGSQPNPLQHGTMSPQGNQLNPIGSPPMTIEELKMAQSANMSPSGQMTVPSEVQMGEMTPTPPGQQVPIHILKKLDANQLQQLQSGSPVPITENQLQEIQGGQTPVDDSQLDLFASGDEDQLRNEEPMKKSKDIHLHKDPIDSKKHFTPESFKMKYAPSGSIEYDNEVEVIEDDETKDLEIVAEDFNSTSEDSDGDPTYQPDSEDDTDEEEIPTITSPFQGQSNDGRSKSAPVESTIVAGNYRYVKIDSNFLDGLRSFENQNHFRMSNISEGQIFDEDGFEITVKDILRKDEDESENSPLFLSNLSISASKKQQKVLKSTTSTKRKLDNRPLETPPPKVKASARSKLSINNDDKDTTKFTVKSGGMSGGLVKVREEITEESNDPGGSKNVSKWRNKSKSKLGKRSDSTAKALPDDKLFKKLEIPKRNTRLKSPVLPGNELRVGLKRLKTVTPTTSRTSPAFLTSENEEPDIPDCSYGK